MAPPPDLAASPPLVTSPPLASRPSQAVFSTFAYLVNLLLASRFLPVAPKLSLTLSVLALVIYAGCLAINWVWQLRFLGHLWTRGLSLAHGSSVVVYLALISLVVRDDCVLVNWLWRNVDRQWDITAAAVKQSKAARAQAAASADGGKKIQ